jgi:glycosyltransferase involved in cell wall biosynthesis
VRYFRGLHECVAPRLLREVWKWIPEVDVVHLTSIYNFPVIPTLLFCRLRRKPLVWSPRGALNSWHGEPKRFLKALFRTICRAAAPKAIMLHVTSKREADYASAKFPAIRTVIVPNGVAVPATIHRTEPSSRLRIAYLGRLHPIKGVELLIAACSQLGEVPWALTIAGYGEAPYLEQLRRLCRTTGISESVTFAGFIDGAEERAALFANTDLFVLPSYSENFGLVVAEALAHGVPVVTTTRTPWNTVDQMKCGVCVEPTVEDLARGIRRAAAQPLREMGDRGREWMRSAFQWQAISAELIQTYAALAKS